MAILLEDKVKIGDSMSKNIDYHYDPKEKIFYSKHKNGAEFIEMEVKTMFGLLAILKAKRDRLEWTKDGIKLFPNFAPTDGKIGRKRISKGESKMMKNEIKSMIKEELLKVLSEKLLVEKFESKKLSRLAKEKDFKRSKFFKAAASTYSIAWDKVPDAAVTLNKPSGNADVMNFFFVDKRQSNPFAGNSWDGTIYPGFIGATKGKKLIHISRSRWGDRDQKVGTGKPGERMGSQTAGLHNFKRYAEVADRVYSIDISKLKGGTDDKKADRKAAKAGATALMSAKNIAGANRSRYEKLLTDRLANSSPGDQIIKMVDAVTKMYKASIDKQVDMLKSKKVISGGWNNSATLVSRAYRDIMKEFEYYISAENQAIRGKKSDAEAAKKLKAGDKEAWSEEKYYLKEMVKQARNIQKEYKNLKIALKKIDASTDYIDIR
jgi:hypothetical protein